MVRALIGLFKAFADRQNSETPSQAVDPTQLRKALGNLEGDKFRVGMLSLSHCNSTEPCLCLVEVMQKYTWQATVWQSSHCDKTA